MMRQFVFKFEFGPDGAKTEILIHYYNTLLLK